MFLLLIVVRNSLLLLIADTCTRFIALNDDVVIAAETAFIISKHKRQRNTSIKSFDVPCVFLFGPSCISAVVIVIA